MIDLNALLIAMVLIGAVIALFWTFTAAERDQMAYFKDAELALMIDYCNTHGLPAGKYEQELARRQK